jgi:hypothetical protein
MRLFYQAEKFLAARSCLMLPHPSGETKSIADAFMECDLGLHNLDRNSLDDAARSLIRKLESLMCPTGLSDPSDRGLWTVKAETLTVDDRTDLSRIVNELAIYFSDKCRS